MSDDKHLASLRVFFNDRSSSRDFLEDEYQKYCAGNVNYVTFIELYDNFQNIVDVDDIDAQNVSSIHEELEKIKESEEIMSEFFKYYIFCTDSVSNKHWFIGDNCDPLKYYTFYSEKAGTASEIVQNYYDPFVCEYALKCEKIMKNAFLQETLYREIHRYTKSEPFNLKEIINNICSKQPDDIRNQIINEKCSAFLNFVSHIPTFKHKDAKTIITELEKCDGSDPSQTKQLTIGFQKARLISFFSTQQNKDEINALMTNNKDLIPSFNDSDFSKFKSISKSSFENKKVFELAEDSNIPSFDGINELNVIKFLEKIIQLFSGVTEEKEPIDGKYYSFNQLQAESIIAKAIYVKNDDDNQLKNSLDEHFMDTGTTTAIRAALNLKEAFLQTHIFDCDQISTVLSNASNYFESHNIQLFSDSVDNFQRNYKLVDVKNIIREFEYVEKFINNDFLFEVSKEGVSIVKQDLGSIETVLSIERTRVVVTKLSITICSKEVEESEELRKKQENIESFVKIYQKLSSLSNRMAELAEYNLEVKPYRHNSLKINNLLQRQIQSCINIKERAILPIIKNYKGPVTCLTTTQICGAFDHFNKDEGSQVLKIFLSAMSPKNANTVYERLINYRSRITMIEEFISEFNNAYKDIKEYIKFDTLLNYTDDTKNIIKKILMSREISKVAVDSTEEAVHMIAYMLTEFTDPFNKYPESKQLLVCTPQTTMEQLSAFLKSFAEQAAHQPDLKCESKHVIYILLNPQELEPKLITMASKFIARYKSLACYGAHLVVMVCASNADPSQEIDKTLMSFSSHKFNGRFTMLNFYGFEQIPTYFIYTSIPRVGKDQAIMKHITRKHPSNDYIYSRIIIDNDTTVSSFAKELNNLPTEEGKFNCVHLSIDGNIDHHFTYILEQLYLFNTVNDGGIRPFIYRKEIEFYMELGVRPFCNDSDIVNAFPLCRYMKRLNLDGVEVGGTEPERNDEERFSFGAFESSQVKGKNYNYLAIKYNENAHVNLIPACVLVYMVKLATTKVNERCYIFRENGNLVKTNKLASDVCILEKAARKYTVERYEEVLEEVRQQIILPQNSKAVFLMLKECYSQVIREMDNTIDPKLLISQVIDITQMITSLQGPFVSRYVHENEVESYEVRLMIGREIIETAIFNVGFPYIEKVERPEDKSEIGKQDTKRLEAITNFIGKNKGIIAITNTDMKDPEEQAFFIISNNKDAKKRDIMTRLNFIKENETEDNINQALKFVKIVDYYDFQKLQEKPHLLFNQLGDFLDFNRKIHDLNLLVQIVKTYNDIPDEELGNKVKIVWCKELFDDFGTRSVVNPRHMATYYPLTADFDVTPGREFLNLVRHLFYEPVTNPAAIEMKNELKNGGFVDLVTFVGLIEQQISKKRIMSYSNTSHSIIRFLNIKYRINANLPIVLMGETGSGKTFSIEFMAESLGNNCEFKKRVVDASTTAEDIDQYLGEVIDNVKEVRERNNEAALNEYIGKNTTHELFKEFVNFIRSKGDKYTKEFLDDPAELDFATREFTKHLYSNQDLVNQFRLVQSTEQKTIGYLKFLVQTYLNRRTNADNQVLIFIDEVNTAPCQWKLKQIIIDRIFRNKPIPSFVHFITAVNPYRTVPEYLTQELEALTVETKDKNIMEMNNLIYKVYQMPESFMPFLMPADPERSIPSEDQLLDENCLNEFEYTVDQICKNVYKKVACEFDYCDTSHLFAESSKFSQSLTEDFFIKLAGGETEGRHFKDLFSQLLSELNYVCTRHLVMVFNDLSFSSLREPTRCSQLLGWFYKFGIHDYIDIENEHDKEKLIMRLRRALILSVSLSYMLRLTEKKKARSSLVENACKMWKKFYNRNCTTTGCTSFKEMFKAPTAGEWKQIFKSECIAYANDFVDKSEGLSLNDPLCENIWATFCCTINRIPLWIIGMPGTSKSLAVNIVLKKFSNEQKNMSIEKWQKINKIELLPPLIRKTYMCSQSSTSAALLDQINKLVSSYQESIKNNVDDHNKHCMIIQILEEIGHADVSKSRPLKCLHRIIDDGVVAPDGSVVRINIIGLSNYKMDSAKLNRGILILRGTLENDQVCNTLKDIYNFSLQHACERDYDITEINTKASDDFKLRIKDIADCYTKFYSTNSEIQKYIGLRDVYGFVQCAALFTYNKPRIIPGDVAMAIRRNFSGIPVNLSNKCVTFFNNLLNTTAGTNNFNITYLDYNPLTVLQKSVTSHPDNTNFPVMRHCLVSTRDMAALQIILETDMAKENAEVFFATKIDELGEEEWVTNELTRFTRAMAQGKLVIFSGHHPCFDSLYDIFNLRYKASGGANFALIAHGGDSYPVQIHPKAHVIIVVNDNEYQELPPPFLNRFEKSIFDYDIGQTYSLRIDTDEIFSTIPKETLPCFNSQFFRAMHYIIQQPKESLVKSGLARNAIPSRYSWELSMLSISPANIMYYTRYLDDDGIELMRTPSLVNNASLHSTIPHLIETYCAYRQNDDEFIMWLNGNSMKDLSSVMFDSWIKNKGVQAITIVPSLKGAEFDKLSVYGDVAAMEVTPHITESMIEESFGKINSETSVIVFYSTKPNDILDIIPHIKWLIHSYRRSNPSKTIHAFIVLEVEAKKQINLIPCIDWPILGLDAPISTRLVIDYSKVPDGTSHKRLRSLLPRRKPQCEVFSEPTSALSDEERLASICGEIDVKKIVNEVIEKMIGSPKEDLDEKITNHIYDVIEGSDIFSGFHDLYLMDLPSPPLSLSDFIGYRIETQIRSLASYAVHVLLNGAVSETVSDKDMQIFNRKKLKESEVALPQQVTPNVGIIERLLDDIPGQNDVGDVQRFELFWNRIFQFWDKAVAFKSYFVNVRNYVKSSNYVTESIIDTKFDLLIAVYLNLVSPNIQVIQGVSFSIFVSNLKNCLNKLIREAGDRETTRVDVVGVLGIFPARLAFSRIAPFYGFLNDLSTWKLSEDLANEDVMFNEDENVRTFIKRFTSDCLIYISRGIINYTFANESEAILFFRSTAANIVGLYQETQMNFMVKDLKLDLALIEAAHVFFLKLASAKRKAKTGSDEQFCLRSAFRGKEKVIFKLFSDAAAKYNMEEDEGVEAVLSAMMTYRRYIE